MPYRTVRVLLMALSLSAGVPARAADLRLRSGPARVSLIELYTSEGCSSCPPAERWLGALQGDPALWREVVPVAFHVTYWDDLGWLDRFAAPGFTQRQYAYARRWGSASVYTPCFVRDGREWRPAGEPEAGGGSPGLLTAALGADGRCTVEFRPTADAAGPFEAHVALLGGGLSSKVAAGENSGRNLSHEFVALGLSASGLAASDGAFRAQLSLPRSPIEAPRRAVAVWVTRPGDPAPLQAAGGWLP